MFSGVVEENTRGVIDVVVRSILHLQYRGVDKSLARPGRKQANVSVRMA